MYTTVRNLPSSPRDYEFRFSFINLTSPLVVSAPNYKVEGVSSISSQDKVLRRVEVFVLCIYIYISTRLKYL